jgi:hypothetical protein
LINFTLLIVGCLLVTGCSGVEKNNSMSDLNKLSCLQLKTEMQKTNASINEYDKKRQASLADTLVPTNYIPGFASASKISNNDKMKQLSDKAYLLNLVYQSKGCDK